MCTGRQFSSRTTASQCLARGPLGNTLGQLQALWLWEKTWLFSSTRHWFSFEALRVLPVWINISSYTDNAAPPILPPPCSFSLLTVFHPLCYRRPSTAIVFWRRACIHTKEDNEADRNQYDIISHWFSTGANMLQWAPAERHQLNESFLWRRCARLVPHSLVTLYDTGMLFGGFLRQIEEEAGAKHQGLWESVACVFVHACILLCGIIIPWWSRSLVLSPSRTNSLAVGVPGPDWASAAARPVLLGNGTRAGFINTRL